MLVYLLGKRYFDRTNRKPLLAAYSGVGFVRYDDVEADRTQVP